jgi:hypothetical protein
VVKPRTILIALIIVFAGLLLGRHLLTGEEKKVKKQFQLLTKWVSKGRGEGAIKTASKSQSLGSLFADPCTFTTELHSLSGNYSPSEIASYAARARVEFVTLSLRFYDLNVEFPKEGVARVTLTMKVTGRMTGGDWFQETQGIQCLLKKVENRWLFSEVGVVEFLQK